MTEDVELLYKDYIARACEKASKDEVVQALQNMFSTAIQNKRNSEKNFKAYESWKKNSEDWRQIYFRMKSNFERLQSLYEERKSWRWK